MSESSVVVSTFLDNKVYNVPYTSSTTAEDVCIYVCKQLNIGTNARHLFALRLSGKQTFLMPAATFTSKTENVEFRIRFKVPQIGHLKKIDPRAYEYYFQQARVDVLENKVPGIVFEKCRKELIGLGITDMYRVMREKEIPLETVENDYKKYIPKEVIRKHSIFVKRPIHETLVRLQKASYDSAYVKAEYLRQLDIIGPEYLTEQYKALTEIGDGAIGRIIVKVAPLTCTPSGLLYSIESKNPQWNQICTFEELVFITIRDDATVEICRKTGIPFYLKFQSMELTLSFISILDGYYRLMCKWTFNICKDVQTPSLQKLYAMRCHGPVGGEFSYYKLELKRGNKPGCFIIRESESKYNHYYIDVCVKNSIKPKTFKLERLNDVFIFNDDLNKYTSIQQLMTAYSDPNGQIFLQECLPPTEYDDSPLLLCKSRNLVGDSLTDSLSLNSLIPSSPVCINSRDLQIYEGQKKEGSRGITFVYRSMWKVTKGKKIEVAMKTLKPESADRFLKDFLTLGGQWAFLKNDSIVRMYGITLYKHISLITEYFRLGTLDKYLRDNRSIIQPVDLIEAASNLASALWHLEENGILHGYIRCRKLMVAKHDKNSFKVKLMDPGIKIMYTSQDVHWIPIECYENFEYAKESYAADVWAFATTLWEIFTYGGTIETGDHIQAMKSYASGKRLAQPIPHCPSEIYDIMKACWEIDPYRRKQPQAIMRDINQMLYQVYNSRRTHSYAKVFNKSISNGTSTSGTSLKSGTTESTLIGSESDLCSLNETDSQLSGSSTGFYPRKSHDFYDENNGSCDFLNLLSTFSLSAPSIDSLNSMQSVIELDDDCNVVLQGKIGQGFYGEVYKGTLEYIGNSEMEPRRVAVKRLKASSLSSCLQDFEREINIMKGLKHPNIVEICGVQRDPEISLVMEFLPCGSLQSYLKIHRESLEVKQLLKYALDIANGMEYLGKKNIVHRDLAARNILVVDEHHVKISDFGLAQVIDTNDYYILKTNRELPIKWYAPESLRDGKFSVRSDVWSFGVTMCEMFNYGEEPHLTNLGESVEGQEQQILLNALEQGARYPAPAMCPQAVYNYIIYPCWKADPHERPTFSKLVKDTEELLIRY